MSQLVRKNTALFSSDMQVQRLELEKKHLELMIETMKKQHEDEMRVLEDSYK